jgi:hypothetical protein
MKLDLTQTFKDSMTGDDILFGADGICPTCGELRSPQAMTLRFVAYNALITPLRGDDQLSGDEKGYLGMLADQIAVLTEMEFSPKELTKIQERVEKRWGNLVVFKFHQIVGHKPSGSVDDKPAGKRLSK